MTRVSVSGLGATWPLCNSLSGRILPSTMLRCGRRRDVALVQSRCGWRSLLVHVRGPPRCGRCRRSQMTGSNRRTSPGLKKLPEARMDPGAFRHPDKQVTPACGGVITAVSQSLWPSMMMGAPSPPTRTYYPAHIFVMGNESHRKVDRQMTQLLR